MEKWNGRANTYYPNTHACNIRGRNAKKGTMTKWEMAVITKGKFQQQQLLSIQCLVRPVPRALQAPISHQQRASLRISIYLHLFATVVENQYDSYYCFFDCCFVQLLVQPIPIFSGSDPRTHQTNVLLHPDIFPTWQRLHECKQHYLDQER